MLPIPHYLQRNEYFCGPACLKMVLRHFGRRAHQRTLAKAASTREQTGTSRKKVISTLRNNGLRCFVRSPARIDDMKQALERKMPVIVDYHEPGENVTHFAVVMHVGSSAIKLHDPWHGPLFTLTKREFLSRWRGNETAGAKPRWMVAIGTREQTHSPRKNGRNKKTDRT